MAEIRYARHVPRATGPELPSRCARYVAGIRLTLKQLSVMRYIRDFTDREGISPTRRELAVWMRTVSHAGVGHYLSSLESKGLLARTPLEPRGLRLTPLALGVLEEADR